MIEDLLISSELFHILFRFVLFNLPFLRFNYFRKKNKRNEYGRHQHKGNLVVLVVIEQQVVDIKQEVSKFQQKAQSDNKLHQV